MERYKYKYIKHFMNKDVCFQVTDVRESDKHYHLEGNWWNIVSQPYVITKDEITIKEADQKNWQEYFINEE